METHDKSTHEEFTEGIKFLAEIESYMNRIRILESRLDTIESFQDYLLSRIYNLETKDPKEKRPVDAYIAKEVAYYSGKKETE